MGGATRLSYHGVPRILEAPEIIWPESNARVAKYGGRSYFFFADSFYSFLRSNRININVRQVYAQDKAT